MARTSQQILDDAAAAGNPAAQRELNNQGNRGTFLGRPVGADAPAGVQAIARLGQNIMGRGRGGQAGGRIRDQLPEVPSITETPTGITGPGGGQTEAELGQDVVNAVSEQAQAEFESAGEVQRSAEDFAGDIRDQVAGTGERVEDVQGDLVASQQDLGREIDRTLENLEEIPGQVVTEFDRLREELGGRASAAFDRIDSERSEALGQVMEGRSSAMQAAVQGIQGNVNTQVSQIMANPNLSNAQKQSMVSQVRLAGASAIAPAIGQTVLGFNQLSADIATSFGTIVGALEGQIVGEFGAFGRAAGQAFADATVASQDITTQLLGVQANSDVAYAGAQAALEGIRSQAEMTGNQLLLDNLPNTAEPVLNVTDAASAAMLIGTDLSTRQFQRESTVFGQRLMMELMQSSVGTTASRIMEAVFGGWAQGGPAGAVMGLATQGANEVLNPYPTF